MADLEYTLFGIKIFIDQILWNVRRIIAFQFFETISKETIYEI